MVGCKSRAHGRTITICHLSTNRFLEQLFWAFGGFWRTAICWNHVFRNSDVMNLLEQQWRGITLVTEHSRTSSGRGELPLVPSVKNADNGMWINSRFLTFANLKGLERKTCQSKRLLEDTKRPPFMKHQSPHHSGALSFIIATALFSTRTKSTVEFAMIPLNVDDIKSRN